MSSFFCKLRSLFSPAPAPADAGACREAFFSLFKQLGRNGIELKLLPDAAPVRVGGSKIGGCPDLPPGFEWPTYTDFEDGKENPLSFMAQVNLADAAPFDLAHELPPTGMLLFFYDMESAHWGFDPRHKGCAFVYYVEDTVSLTRGSFPEALAEEYRYAERAVSLASALIPPDCANISDETDARIRAIVGGDWDKATDMYCDLRDELRGYSEHGDNGSYLLGWPDIQQDVMEEECEMVARGMEEPSLSKLDEATRADVLRASRDWVLLFQLASIMDEEKGDLMFGDLGNLYFWIRKQDLAARDFSKAWLILQCG